MTKILQYVGPTHNSTGEETVNHSQHVAAVDRGRTNAQGRALIQMLKGWEAYQTAYHATYDDAQATPEQNEMDAVIGRYWAETGLAIKRLLDGETGGLDCHSIASNITAAVVAEGFETDGYSLTGE